MKTLSSVIAVLFVASCALVVCGCNDETKADPAVLESMNKQRAAQPAGGTPAEPGAAPGTAPK
jgi:hypothetical protein